jgi:hypothetical protein
MLAVSVRVLVNAAGRVVILAANASTTLDLHHAHGLNWDRSR